MSEQPKPLTPEERSRPQPNPEFWADWQRARWYGTPQQQHDARTYQINWGRETGALT
jgi:hypothetical protein